MEVHISTSSVQDILAVIALGGSVALIALKEVGVPAGMVLALICVAVLVGGG